MFFTLRPKVGIAVGLFANLMVYLGWNMVLCRGLILILMHIVWIDVLVFYKVILHLLQHIGSPWV